MEIGPICGAIFEAVQQMKVSELKGERGMSSLEFRIKSLLNHRYPDIMVEDIQFLDFTIL
jgi:hypothetical protein